MLRTRLPFRPALLAMAVLALLAVVALASRTDRPSRPGDPDVRTLPAVFWDYIVTIGMLVIVGVVALALLLRVPLSGGARQRLGFSQLLGIALICGLVALAGMNMERPRGLFEEDSPNLQGQPPAEPVRQGEEQRSDERSRSVELKWSVVFGAGALVLLGLGIYVARRRLQTGRSTKADAATALSAALDDSLDDLRAERDSRRAVIAAYARMEGALDRHGLPRVRSEAPLEYLARVLRVLRVRSSAVLALTELFERAKFSRHDIDAEMKEEAIGALMAVRDDLRVTAET